MQRSRYDAVVVGSGPNGLAAAITMATAGLSTLLVEASAQLGGGTRSSALTIEGAIHDECSAVHPLGAASPFFRALGLEQHGLAWVASPTPLAHVMSDGTAVVLEKSVQATVDALGSDGGSYARLVSPFVPELEPLLRMILAPLRIPPRPFLLGHFGLAAIQSMRGLARDRFDGHAAPALLAGIAAHAMVPLEEPTTAAIALVLALAAHRVGWPIARGGSQRIADALVACFESRGGEIERGWTVQRLSELPPARAYLFDVSARSLLAIAGDRLSASYGRRASAFRYGPGVYKADWALRGPIPWRDERCRRAVTVHLSGTLDDVSRSVRAVHEGRLAERPFVLLGQPSIVDATRAPAGVHTAWGYCHVPHGSTVDALERMEAHIETHAPGFRSLVVGRSVRNAAAVEGHDPNFVGGDINSGLSDWSQIFFRPMAKVDPYATSDPSIYLCSSSTPPGGGVHGMCGYWAAASALRRAFAVEPLPLATGLPA